MMLLCMIFLSNTCSRSLCESRKVDLLLVETYWLTYGLKFREYNGELQLRDNIGGGFAVLTEDLWEDLDEFRE